MSNAAINVLTTISLVWLVIIIGVTVGRIIAMVAKRDTAKLYAFLKKFKTGSCFLVYFAAIPLYFSALYYGGATIGDSIFTSIEYSVSLIVLFFDYGTVAPLIAANTYFAVVMYICYVTVILNAVLFAVSLAGFKVRNFTCKTLALYQKENVYIIVGYNEDNKRIIESISKKNEKDSLRQEIEDKEEQAETLKEQIAALPVQGEEGNNLKQLQNRLTGIRQEIIRLERKLRKIKGEHSILLVNEKNLGEKDALNLLMIENGSGYTDYKTAEFCKLLDSLAGRRKLWQKRAVNIIINSGDISENLMLTQELGKFLNNHKDISHSILNRDGVNGYVFCEPKDTSTFNYYVESSHGAIQYLNKYRLVAMDFITRYPLTKFMKEEIDGEYPALKKETEVNFVMIGFGKLNRQLFHTSVSTQQFLSVERDGDGKAAITEKPVRYCIYDKEDSNADLILNHNYSRYGNFLERNKDRLGEFLPLPEMPADVRFHKMSIRDKGFYNSLYSDLSGDNKYSYIVVAYGSDMENLDFGQKIAAKLMEWNLREKVKLFVKIRNHKLIKDSKDSGIIFIGNESEVVYNINAILHEDIEVLAKKRHRLYVQVDKDNQDLDNAAIEKKAIDGWYRTNSQCQREANIYACMSLRPKLNLLGFDIRKKGEGNEPSAAEEFMQIYQSGGDLIRYITQDADKEAKEDKANSKGKKEREADGKPVYRQVEYKNEDFERDSIRKYCAVIEHQRWNANFISWGFVPATKEEIKGDGNGKNFAIRRHGCLTTFEGLKEFRDIVAAKNLDFDPHGKLSDGQKERYADALEQADVIRYDYQILDDVVWLLNESGYELIKRAV